MPDSRAKGRVSDSIMAIELCDVTFSVTFNGEAVEGANVVCSLEKINNILVGYMASREVLRVVTNNIGECVLKLIQFGQFTSGGVYRIRVYDEKGKLLSDRRVTVPNVVSCRADELVDIGNTSTTPIIPTEPSNLGTPIGLLLSLTYSGASGTTTPTTPTTPTSIGSPLGLLLTLTKAA